ncbi:MAG: response regulator [bacterium]
MAKSFKTAKTIKLFLDECREYLDSLDHDLVTLEGGDADDELMKRVKRNVHTLKGSSAMLEFNDISKISNSIEDVIAIIEPRLPEVDGDMVGQIFDKVDRIKELVAKIERGEYEEGGGEEPPQEKPPAPPPEKKKPVEDKKAPPPEERPETAKREAEEKAETPPPAPQPGTERVDLMSVLGERLRPGLERCFKLFQDVESKFVLAEGREPDAELIDSLFEDTRYLFSTLAPMGAPSVCHILHRLEMVLDAVKEGKIPRAEDLVEFVFSGITIVRAIVENRLASRPEGEIRGAAKWQADAEKRLKPLTQDKDSLTEDAALEIFRRLSIEEDVAALLEPFEKQMIAQQMIHGNQVFHVSFVVPASEREVLMDLPEAGKAFFEKGRIAASIYQICSTPQGLAYRVHFFQTTDVHEEELEEVTSVLEDVKDLKISHISLLSDHPVEKKPKAAKAAPAAGKKTPELETAPEKEEAPPEKPGKAAAKRRDDSKGPAQSTVRVDTEKLDVMVNLIAELVINHNKMEQELRTLKQLTNQTGEIYETVRDSKKRAFEHSYQETTLESLIQPLKKMDITSFDTDFSLEIDSFNPLLRNFMDSRSTLQEEITNLYGQAVEGEKNIEELIDGLGVIKKSFDALFLEFQNDEINIGRVIDDLQEETMKLRMLPVSQVFNKFPRRVRDIARDMNKKVEFSMMGEDTELDKTLIEEIEEPLLHLIRNAIDHGIETTEERLRNGKIETGTIRMNSYYEGNTVVVEVEDDGKGIDPEKVKRKAIEKRIISPEEAAPMDARAAINLIFQPGFSTKDEVSDLSGRGVGMDVVKNNIQKLKGTVGVSSEVGGGTVFKLKLPLTLAIIQAMIVKCGGMKFVIPMDPIEATELLTPDRLLSVENKEVFRYQELVVPVVRLADVFKLESVPTGTAQPVVVAGIGDRKIGIVVDEVIEKQQVVIKTLGAFLGEVRHIVGATIFGDGSIALIIDIGGIVSSLSQIVQRAHRPDAVKAKKRAKRVLLVDDSLSGRIAQRDMLERMGFHVEVASSGFQALEMLGEKEYDAVVTDINMPRMDGYEFTARMRSDESTRRMPVVMVTSDIKRADRQKGFDVGINEFLAKPFSDDDLRQAIEKHV